MWWQKIKSAFGWTWKQIKAHRYLAVATTLVLAAAAYFILPLIGVTALSIGIAAVTCIIAGPALGGFLGWLGKRIGHRSRPPTRLSISPQVVNLSPDLTAGTRTPTVNPESKADVATAPSASTSSSLSSSPASLFKKTSGVPSLKETILAQLGIEGMLNVIAETKDLDQQALFLMTAPRLMPHFLQLVAYGRQAEAEEMLKKVPQLLLEHGEVTDNAGRTFKNITAFQYAIWAKDRHMWQMLRKYMTNEEAAKQLREHENEDKATQPDYVRTHGKYFSFQELRDALHKHIVFITFRHVSTFNWDEAARIWTKEVGLDGGAQSRVPAHVVNEYCHPQRSFDDPRKSFMTDTDLPRRVNFFNTTTKENIAWFPDPALAVSDPYSVGIYRGSIPRSPAEGQPQGPRGGAGDDYQAMIALDEVRTEEIKALKAELMPAPVARVAASR